MALEQRTINATVRAAADSKDFELVGLAAAYNSLSSDVGGFKEIIAPGAFTRALKSKPDVRCLVNHEASQILGRTKSGTLTLSDSPEGLRFLCRLNPESESHRNVYAAVQRGDIDQCSFAFTVVPGGDKFENPTATRDYVKRTLTDVDISDVSVVTFPAYPNGTRVQARSANYSPTRLVTVPNVGTWDALRKKADRQKMEMITDRKFMDALWQGVLDRTPEGMRKRAERQAAEIAVEQQRVADQNGDPWR